MRLFVPGPLNAHTDLSLPPGPARHAQVRRVQPGDVLQLFDGSGVDWPATVLAVGRSTVEVHLGSPQPVRNELPVAVHLAVGMPANERMDNLIEKATELGVATVQPLLCERAVLRLDGERAQRKQAHWQAVAQAACEQSGRAHVPAISPVLTLPAWLKQQAAPGDAHTLRLVLSLRADACALASALTSAWPRLDTPGTHGNARTTPAVWLLSGPEGGLAATEEDAARALDFKAISLGPRTLRADTAPLAALAWFSLLRNLPGEGQACGLQGSH